MSLSGLLAPSPHRVRNMVLNVSQVPKTVSALQIGIGRVVLKFGDGGVR